MVSLLSRDNWSIGHQREVNPGVWHQVSLELCQVNIQSTVKSERSCDGGDNLSNKPVQVCVGGSLNVQVSSADVIDGLIVDHKGTVRVLKGGVGGQNRVVWLDNSGGNLNKSIVSRVKN